MLDEICIACSNFTRVHIAEARTLTASLKLIRIWISQWDLGIPANIFRCFRIIPA